MDAIKYSQRIMLCTALTSILAFVATAMSKFEHRAMVSLFSGALGVLATTLLTFRNQEKVSIARNFNLFLF